MTFIHFHGILLLTNSDSPNSSALYFRPSTLISAGLSSVLFHQSSPKVQPHGTWLSPEALRTVPLCAFACAVHSTPLCLPKSNTFFTVQFKHHCLMETLWFPWRQESVSPLCHFCIFTDLLLEIVSLPGSCQSYLYAVFSLLSASLYFIYLCISQRALQPLDPQSVFWMAYLQGGLKPWFPWETQPPPVFSEVLPSSVTQRRIRSGGQTPPTSIGRGKKIP